MHKKKRKYTTHQWKTTTLDIHHHHQELAVPCAKYKRKVKRAKIMNKLSVT